MSHKIIYHNKKYLINLYISVQWQHVVQLGWLTWEYYTTVHNEIIIQDKWLIVYFICFLKVLHIKTIEN